MFKTDTIKHIHFVGVGGAGMIGIAEVLLRHGYAISGSDLNWHEGLTQLETLGAKIYRKHCQEHIIDADVVVYSSAISDDNVELIAAHQHHIPILKRAEMLAEIMRFYFSIAVAGTHGKTTTTSMIAHVLAELKLDPSYVIGGIVTSHAKCAQLGQSDFFVAEADESDASFLYFQPMLAVITNIDLDHMDQYDQDRDKLDQAFLSFLHRMPFYGQAIVCIEDAGVKRIIEDIRRPTITYGLSDDAMVWASEISLQQYMQCFTLHGLDQKQHSVQLPILGEHNILNVLAAYVVCHSCGVESEAFVRAMETFAGVKRRFQMLGDFKLSDGRMIQAIDDYGHHAKEVEVTIKTARQVWPGRRIVMCFQPHRYTRTRDLFAQFSQVLGQVDELYLLNIYPSHEQPIPGVSSASLAQAIRAHQKPGVKVYELGQLDHAQEVLQDYLQDGDVFIFQGAGDISKLTRYYLQHWVKSDETITDNRVSEHQ